MAGDSRVHSSTMVDIRITFPVSGASEPIRALARIGCARLGVRVDVGKTRAAWSVGNVHKSVCSLRAVLPALHAKHALNGHLFRRMLL
jgi:hypothetical protein